MSFGFGIGDIIACTEIAVKTVDALRSAGPEFEGLRLEVSSLTSVLGALEAEARGPMPLIHSAPRDRQEQMGHLLDNCRSGMQDLRDLVDKYGSMGESRKGDFVEWMRFAARDKRSPREKLAIHTASINIFLTTLSHGSLARLEFLIKNGRQENPRAATASMGQREVNLWATSVPDVKPSTSRAWKSIIECLAEEGIEDEQVDKFQEEVKAYVRYLVRGETPFWKHHRPRDEKLAPPEPSATSPAFAESAGEREKKRSRLRSELERARQTLWPPSPSLAPMLHMTVPPPPMHETAVYDGPKFPMGVLTDVALTKTTSTRMARKHLSVEALRAKSIEFEVDESHPEYLIVKRWVPPEEQDELETLTRTIRDDRERVTGPPVYLRDSDRPTHPYHRRHRSGDDVECERSSFCGPYDTLVAGSSPRMEQKDEDEVKFDAMGNKIVSVKKKAKLTSKETRRRKERMARRKRGEMVFSDDDEESENPDDNGGGLVVEHPPPVWSPGPVSDDASVASELQGLKPLGGRIDMNTDGVVNSKDEYPVGRGETRIPTSLFSRRAVLDSGYPFIEDDNKLVILQALSQTNIDKLLRLSEEYRRGKSPLASGTETERRDRGEGEVVEPERLSGGGLVFYEENIEEIKEARTGAELRALDAARAPSAAPGNFESSKRERSDPGVRIEKDSKRGRAVRVEQDRMKTETGGLIRDSQAVSEGAGVSLARRDKDQERAAKQAAAAGRSEDDAERRPPRSGSTHGYYSRSAEWWRRAGRQMDAEAELECSRKREAEEDEMLSLFEQFESLFEPNEKHEFDRGRPEELRT